VTRQQEWAKAAFKAVALVKTSKDAEHYRTLCMNTPYLIKQSGLVQAVAFLLRDQKKNGAFVDDLAKALAKPDRASLQRDAQEFGLAQYMGLTRDAIAVAVWFRRFAQSELKAPEASP
jgi:CRISPR/Cas system CMR-associated protein Cmr5 small subunit